MQLTRSAQNELVLPLFENLFTDAHWDIFLTRLLARTGADRVFLLRPDAVRRISSAGRGDPAADELAALGGPSSALRPNRVYALEELRNLDSKEAGAAEAAALATAKINDARLIRIGARENSTWLILLAERITFSAADSALMTSLAPAIEIAADQFAAITALRRRAEAAEGSLELLGIGQAVLGAKGEVLAADPLWQSRKPVLPRLPQIALAPSARKVARAADDTPLLLRATAREGDGAIAAVATFRLPRREPPQGAARVLAITLGLSAREALLAALLSQGLSLLEAGRSLNLTDETTRNYSKRIYAKTGARGQGDLVRIVMCGLAVLS